MNRFLLVPVLVIAVAARLAAADEAFNFDALKARAQSLAAKPYVPPASHLPDWLEKATYDQHRSIKANPDRALWHKEELPFQLQFFHPGWLFKTPVQIHEVVDGKERLVEFSPSYFIYGDYRPAGRVPGDLGFAGLRVHGMLNQPGDELVVFAGASYFRSLGKGVHYGLSARGLAINSGGPGEEEFPRFTDFWVERPKPSDTAVTIHALLDSPSVSGAYRFVLRPGDETVMDIKAALFFRVNPAVVGLAPLTSMFTHGENTGWSKDDFRPEVHDSDGLSMQTGTGEWIWRPVTNPKGVSIASFQDRSPRGFGLIQRDREFAHYDDIVALYHLRTSAWVEPVGDWGAGAVRLFEFNTRNETVDNVVACWVPAQLPPPGQAFEYEYKLHWFGEAKERPPAGRVVSTREGAVLDHDERRRFVIDFDGVELKRGGGYLAPEVTVVSGAKIVPSPGVQWIQEMKVWRVSFEVVADGSGKAVEMRCFLRQKDDVLTETWSHLWNP